MTHSIILKFSVLPITFLLISLSASSQAKLKDIDVLYQKFKNKDTITVTNANGTVKLAVDITLNKNGKPQSIVLKGYADNVTLAESITKKLENDKEKAGYKYNSLATIISDEILNVSVYTKGKEYAKYGVCRDIFGKNDPPPYNTGTDEQKTNRSQKYFFALMGGCFIYMEVGDISRKLNDNSEDFNF